MENYVFSRKWVKKGDSWSPTDKYESRELGLIFLERCISLLQDKGRLAIVLPDTYLFSPSYEWLAEYLLKNFTVTHSINVPIEAFEPHCRAKTSIIVLKKEKPTFDNEIIGSTCETFGEDKHQRPRYKISNGIKTQELDDEMADTAKLLVQSRKHALPYSPELFKFTQKDAMNKRVLVAKYWWRIPYMKALDDFAKRYNCVLTPVKEILEKGELEVFPGHGSPSSHYHGHGNVPYIKVTDIKNWQINENPEYMIPENIATKLRKNKKLQPFDLVTPTRASQNIGLFGVVMPWQTNVILTREINVWRVRKDAKTIDPSLLLNLMSLKVVHDQFNFLVLMQTNREDLSGRYKELLLPIPSEEKTREKWSLPIKNYLEMQIKARESYDQIKEMLNSDLFADRP